LPKDTLELLICIDASRERENEKREKKKEKRRKCYSILRLEVLREQQDGGL